MKIKDLTAFFPTHFLIPLFVLLALYMQGCAGLQARSSDRRATRLGSYSEAQDVSLGMRPNQVRDSWGEPLRIQVAGDQDSGNQRWIYQYPTQTGLSPARIVYFEQGHVVGWEVSDSR